MVILKANNNTVISNAFVIVIFNINDIILRLSVLKHIKNKLFISKCKD